MAEYKVASPEQLARTWTPAQIVVMTVALTRRKAFEDARNVELTYIPVAAAYHQKSLFSSMRGTVRRLREAGGTRRRGMSAEELTQEMGLTVRPAPRKRKRKGQ